LLVILLSTAGRVWWCERCHRWCLYLYNQYPFQG